MAREAHRPSKRHRDASARKHDDRRKRSQPSRGHKKESSASTSDDTRSGGQSHTLSAGALAQLNQENTSRKKSRPAEDPRRERQHREREYRERDYRDRERRVKKATYREVRRDVYESPRGPGRPRERDRVVSGRRLEEGRRLKIRGGHGSYDSVEKEDYDRQPRRTNKKRIWIIAGVIGVLVLILIIAIAVVVVKKNQGGDGSGGSAGLSSISQSSIPSGAPAWLDPYQWVDTVDFNLTYTADTVGSLPVMGLNSSWDDSQAPNSNVPALNQPWGDYASHPARGVNVGGWLSLEPFITPSLFSYDSKLGVIDEYTLCTYLSTGCAAILEKHYSTFVTEDTFRQIAAAGLDHVRIPYSYWAVQTYPGDPYVFRTSWRYLLRGIEWARKHGLRVNLDLHALPGSQNGWNHSGRQGYINWLNGTDGALNAQRSLDIHTSLAQFFSQPRYANIITHYGLANEPRMVALSVSDVMNWTSAAYKVVRDNGIKNAVIVFGDGFMGLNKWQGELTGLSNMALDAHQYVIFNSNQIIFNHTAKVQYACDGWTQQTVQSMNTATGFGPTIIAEWSQADTDCAQYLTNVGWGNRWSGTYSTGNASIDVLTPRCPLQDKRCECNDANADPSQYSSSYKQFLLYFAEAQMHSFEKGWGWWYWTWDTESAAQWSYKKGLAAGILPPLAYNRTFNCDAAVPAFGDLNEAY